MFIFQQDPAPEPPFYIPEQRLVHFDLKGAAPRIEYLLKMLKWAKDTGATGILMEYEDMFPFTGKLASVSASNHYNVSDISSIVDTCHSLGLDIIPLVQTFGHMEFILKLEKFAHLRDTPEMPESICACHDQSMALITDYISQVPQVKNTTFIAKTLCSSQSLLRIKKYLIHLKGDQVHNFY